MQNNYPLHFINERIERMRTKFTCTQNNNPNQISPTNLQIANPEKKIQSQTNPKKTKKKDIGSLYRILETYQIKSVVFSETD